MKFKKGNLCEKGKTSPKISIGFVSESHSRYAPTRRRSSVCVCHSFKLRKKIFIFDQKKIPLRHEGAPSQDCWYDEIASAEVIPLPDYAPAPTHELLFSHTAVSFFFYPPPSFYCNSKKIKSTVFYHELWTKSKRERARKFFQLCNGSAGKRPQWWYYFRRINAVLESGRTLRS